MLKVLAASRLWDITHSANCYHRAPGRSLLFSLPKSSWFPCRDRVSLTCTAFRCHYGPNYGTCSCEELPRFSKTFMSSCPVTKARVITAAAAQVSGGEDVLISDALKLALSTYVGLSIMVSTALDMRPYVCRH